MLQPSKRNGFAVLVSFTFLLVLAPIAHAQSAVDGAIGGTVYDASGAVMPNAKILVVNEGTNLQFEATSDQQGNYRILHLQPANYTVTISAAGFNDYKGQHTVVSVGSLTSAEPHLTVGSAGQTVEVTGESPLINTATPEVASTTTRLRPTRCPSTAAAGPVLPCSRRVRWYRTRPASVLVSFRGTSELLNNNTVDGADDNQAYFSEERGRTRLQYSTSEEAIQEFQVNTSNYSAEYGRSAGGVINTVTKSGTNQIHGQAFFRDRDNGWGALNQYTTLPVQDPTTKTFTNTVYAPKDWRKQWGFGVGGPIMKNRIFWFYAYDQSKRNFPGTARANNSTNFFATPAASVSSCSSATGASKDVCLMQTDLGLPTYAAALAQYNTSFSGLINGVFGSVPRLGDQMINFPKSTGRSAQSTAHHLSTTGCVGLLRPAFKHRARIPTARPALATTT